MIARLLIDECLSPGLVQQAHAAGHVESTCLRDRGRLGHKDHQVLAYALEQEFILVTRNAIDFRGAGEENPGGLYAAVEVHPGLICIESADILDYDTQQLIFAKVLEALTERADLTNTALEFFLDEDEQIFIDEYEIPAITSAAGPK
jgi:predicted nuclease of predicted toxin-antitoxin system